MTIDFVVGGGVGFFTASLFWCRFIFAIRNRLRHTARLQAKTEALQNQRDTIESGRDTVARRSDYLVSEGDLFGTLPGTMTKDHLEDSQRFSAKPVDLAPDWVRLNVSEGQSDQT